MVLDKHMIRDLLSHSSGRDINVGDDESLLTAGIIDSLTMIQLLTAIEERGKIKIRDAELLPENFETVNAIVDFLTKKSG